jgi:hypothetical protein
VLGAWLLGRTFSGVLTAFAPINFRPVDFFLAIIVFLAGFFANFFLEPTFLTACFFFGVIAFLAVPFDLIRSCFFGFFLAAIGAVYHQGVSLTEPS